MKRLFGREKPKIVKTPSATSDLTSEDTSFFTEAQHYQHAQQSYDRMHSQDRVHALAHSSSDEHWDLVNSHDGHSPIPSSYVPRAASPFSGTVSIGSHKSNGDRDSAMLRKKPPNAPSPAAAVGILRALDPHHSHVLTTPPPKEHDREPMLDESLQHRPTEKKEKKGFWERTKDRDKDKDKEEEKKERHGPGHGLRSRDKEKGRKEEEAQAELTRMIGYLTATASEDWSLVLEVCERASANESSARETVRALRREFKYAEPTAQLAAARLWAVLLQNSSSIFMAQSTSRKFIETLEEVTQNPRTSPVVKERLLQVLAAAAHASSARHNRPEKDPFRLLWRKLKAPNQPDEGIPLDPEDAMLNPPAPAMPAVPDPPRTPSGRPPNKHKTSSKIIPPEEDIRRLFEECQYANGNAALLSDALLNAKPEDLQNKVIIKEFYARCRASQELVYAQIPWASVSAERSRQAAIAAVTIVSHRHQRPTSPPSSPKIEVQETLEEQLLAALLSANEQLAESLKMYEDLERIGVEREVQERSRKDTRMNHKDKVRHHNNNSESSIPRSVGHARATPVPPLSPSPSPSPSPPLSVTVTPYNANHSHPLPPIPPNSAHHGQINAQQQLAALALQQQPTPQQAMANLAPPPPAPHGPRRPVPSYRSGGSRSPSPTDRSFIASTGPPSVRTSVDEWDRYGEHRQSVHTPRGNAYSNILEMEDDDGVEAVEVVEEEDNLYERPRGPSAKALGKRKIVEPEDTDSQFDPDDIFYEHNNDSRHSTSLNGDNDSDAEGGAVLRQKKVVNYVYDAAAERTRERIREGRLHLAASNGATLVGGVH